jgi:1,4-alpha-glucan branching enzyme
MAPRPTNRPGLLAIPGPDVSSLAVRFAKLSDRDHFAPANWPQHAFAANTPILGWWQFDLDALALADGVYEYEFVVNGSVAVADPYADTLTRFDGYRGLFTISRGARVTPAFSWDDEFPPGTVLPQNNQVVIYEMPIRWMSSAPGENTLVGLGTFDSVLFERLKDLVAMGINCIELLPIEDSPQTLNWGYGTRFFFAPDYDLGGPVDLKFFVKCCHQQGVRVLLDVVMNMYSPLCPLKTLAQSWFNAAPTPGRQNWSQELFLFDTPSYVSYYAAREFFCEMAEFWVAEYHVDGYRTDDFVDVNNWEFVQQFRDRATAKSLSLFPAKPFCVIAEDSNRRFVTTANDSGNPNGRKVVDAIWNFGYRDEIRRLLTNSIDTVFGQASRSTRVEHLISNSGVWNDWPQHFDTGFADLACSVAYITSHDVADAPRLMNILLGPTLPAAGLGDGGIDSVRAAVDGADASSSAVWHDTVRAGARRVFGGFAILMTSVGMPMFLAGEEFGDVHDMSYTDVNPKQEDPVQWRRAGFAANSELMANLTGLIRLRTSHPALQRNEVEFFYFHPQFDDNDSPRVFAYCRTAGKPLGTPGQVVVIANMGPQSYAVYNIPGWPWGVSALTEVGYPGTPPSAGSGAFSLALDPFGVRVFRT